MIKSIACSEENKEALKTVASESGLCFIGTGECGEYRDGIFADCKRCLEERIEWIIVEEEE